MSEKVISDYNGYDYKKIFWEDADREYEDQADRMAIRKLLPKRMEKFADIGGGYGRLANEYLKRARKVYIFDYSKTELEQAKEIYGDKVETKAGDIYKLPFKDNELDGLMMVRVTHHLKDMEKAFPKMLEALQEGIKMHKFLMNLLLRKSFIEQDTSEYCGNNRTAKYS